MSAFDALRIASSGLGAHQTWLDTLAGNIANVNTARPMNQNAFQAQMLELGSAPGGGVEVVGVATSDPQGRVVNDPGNALADANGNVRMPEVDLASQMSQLIMAQRGYQASVQTTKTAQDTYTAALQIGTGR